MNGLPVAGVFPVDLAGSPDSRLSSLFDTHYDRLYRLARRLTSNVDDALDLVQETFLKAARSPSSVPLGFSNEEAWLVRVLINIRRDQWRKTAVRKRIGREALPSTPNVADGTPETTLVARATVWRALDQLTPRRRAVVILHELEGLTVPSIAALLGITEVTVRWHLSRGRRDLARVLTPQMRGNR